jgi:Fur family ferric uptake transcriptional regulator
MNIKDLLQDQGLSMTNCRKDILNRFVDAGNALSFQDIEGALLNHYDRVTIYRTLKAFAEKGIIHKVLNDTGTVKYALCKQECHNADHNHDHVHFKCIKCEQTNCMDEIKIPQIILPTGYSFLESDLLIRGVCKTCSVRKY